MIASRQFLLAVFALIVISSPCWAEKREAAFHAPSASFEELFRHMQRYGVSDQRREWKRQAHEEILARGPESLGWLLDRVYIKNIWISVIGQELVERLSPGQAVPVLAARLDAERPEVRATAAFWLGTYPKQDEIVGQLLALLEHKKTRGSALRTLGRWKVLDAAPKIAAFLNDPEERVRVRAANALRDLGTLDSAAALRAALNDPCFTVREAAARALTNLGPRVIPQLLRELPRAERLERRQIIRVLGALQSRRAVPALRALLRDPDAGVRGDAARALQTISPQRAPAWLQGLPENERAALLVP